MALKYPDFVSLLIAFLQNADSTLVAKAAKAIAQIASLNHGVISSSVDGIPRLCQVASKKGTEECICSMAALSSLSINPENCKTILGQEGFLPLVVPMLSSDAKSTIFRSAITLLSNLSADSEDVCR